MRSSDNNAGRVWGLAALAGLLAFLALKFLASYGFWAALLLAILIGLLVAILLWIGFYRDEEDGAASGGGETAAREGRGQAGAGAEADGPAREPAPRRVEKPAFALPRDRRPEQPAGAPPEEAGSASGSRRADGGTATRKPAAGSSEAGKPAAGKKETGKTAGKTAAAGKPAAGRAAQKPADRGAAGSGRPPALEGPRDGKADDLKMIKGIGPKLEQLLNSMGIYHFEQIASWSAEEVKWVDENLKGFRGRVSRDEWVRQAGILAEGGSTEFSRRVGRGDVY